MAKVTPRFDLSSEVPAIGDGGFNEDGVVGIYGKGSAKEIQNRLDARRWNEYERVMSLLATGLGDYDFKETFPGLKITNVSDAVRRLKTELSAALALITNANQDNDLDTRLYGIETDWASIGINTLGTISSSFYTPGLTYRYEPSFEIIDTSTTGFKVLGGKISLPDKTLVVVPSLSDSGAYEFDFPETEFTQNVEFVFGPGLSLPVGPENKVEVINGKFSLSVNTLALELLGKPIGTISYGLGAGVKEFQFVNFSGTQTNNVSIVLVSGTISDNFIDSSFPVSYYLGTDTFRSGDLEIIPSGYDVMVDPLSSSGKTTGITDGVYYAYYMVPDTKGYFVGVSKTTGLIELEEADITLSGSVKVPGEFFPLYFIKGDFNPVFSSLQNVVEESRIYTYRRISNPLESSISSSFTNDSVVDVRRFKSKPRPHFVPAWVPKGYLEDSEILRTDINGNYKKVTPLFVALDLRHSKSRYSLENIKDLSTPELTELVRLNHLYSLSLDYIYFPDEFRERNKKKLSRLLTGNDSIYPDIIGFFGKVKYNGNEYTDLTLIDPGLTITTEIVDIYGSKIWKATGTDLSSIYSWSVDPDSTLSIKSLTDLSVKVKVNMELAFPVYLSELQAVLSTHYSKIGSTGAGSSYKSLYDYEVGKERTSSAVEFLSDGTLKVSRSISPLQSEILNLEYFDSENVLNTSTYGINLGLTQRPLWWKVSTSLVNQYIAYYDGTDICIARVEIANPKNWSKAVINFPMIGGESYSLNNPVVGIYQGGFDLQINTPERPKVASIIKGSNYYKVAVASFYESVDIEPDFQTIYSLTGVNTTSLKCIGIFRRYQYDSENSQVSTNLDNIDGVRIIFRDDSKIKIVEIPPMSYINFVGFRSKASPIIYEFPYDNYFTNPEIIVAYVENFRNSLESPKDKTLEEAYCTVALWSSINDRFVTLTIKRDLTEADPGTGSKIIFINSFASDALLTQPRFIRQSNGIEIGGLTLTNTEVRITYNPYTGEESRRVEDLLYDKIENNSIGTFLTIPETGRNSVTLNKDSGDIWSEDIVPSLTERYQDVGSLISGLINSKGLSYKLNNFNSDNLGLSRLVDTRDQFLNVANVRTFPRSAVFTSNLGVARRAGRFTLSDKSEAFVLQKTEQFNTRPNKYGIVLFSDQQVVSGTDISSWPNNIPTKHREDILTGEDSEILIELGSASGSSLDSGIWNSRERLDSFDAEYIHKDQTYEDVYYLHSVRGSLSKYPDSGDDVTPEEIVLPSDRKFIKYGYSSTSVNTPVDNQVYLYMDFAFNNATVTDSITANANDTVLELGYPADPGYLYRTKFYKAGLVLQTNNAPATGIVVVYTYDQYGLLTTQDRTFYRSRTMLGNVQKEVITIDDIGTLDSNKKYTIKLAVKPGQLFSTIDTLKVSGDLAPQFKVRFIANNSSVTLPDSVWDHNLSFKIGGEHIWTPAVKQLTNPWELLIGSTPVDKAIPFITQSREHGLVTSIDAGIKSIWYNNGSQWSEIKVDLTGGLVPILYDARSNGEKVLITNSPTKLYAHKFYGSTWTRYDIGTFTNITAAKAAVSLDSNSIHIAIYDNGVLKHSYVSVWGAGAPGVSTGTIGTYSGLTSLEVKGIHSNKALVGFSVINGANTDIRAAIGSLSTWDDQVALSVANTNFQIKVNQATLFGNTPYVVSSWKTSTTAYYVSVMKGVNYTGGGALTWSENDVTLVSGVTQTVDNATPVFAIYAKPGYLVHAPDPGSNYLIEGFQVVENILDPYYTRVQRSNKLTDIAEDLSGNIIWMGHYALTTDSINVWSMYIPVPQNTESVPLITSDPFSHNNWLFVDVQRSKLLFDNPFWNHLKVKHGMRFIDPVEDTLKAINSLNSIYTDRINQSIGLVSKSRVNLISDIRNLSRRLAAGMFNDWDMLNSGANLAYPTTRTFTKGEEKMRLTYTYNNSGPSINKVNTVFYEYSSDSGATYNGLATETFAYDGNGYLVSTTWS
jgi:hypothetical protein